MTIPDSQPMTAEQFLATLGVNAHTSTGYGNYSDVPDVIADLQYLGIYNVRDGDNGSFNNLVAMAQAGIKFDFLLAGGGSFGTSDLLGEFSVIDQLAQQVPGSVSAVEGANEINNFPITYNGVAGLMGAINLQENIYSITHSDPLLAGVPVYYFTGYDAGNVGTGPNPATTPGLADFDNQHPYPQNGTPPAQWVARSQTLSNENPPIGPAVYNETGYSNSGTYGDNIGLQGQGAYTLDLLMDDAQEGIARTYLYELMEEGDGFGLFTSGNAPTPAATAIHNLTSILGNNGPVSCTVTPASYSVSGLPSDGNDMELIKSDGASDIVVWAEPQITASNPGPTNEVTVTLGATYQLVDVFDPMQSSSPIQTLSNVNSVTVAVTDHPVIIEVNHATISGGDNPPTPTFITAPTIGSGSDKLVLDLSASVAKETVQIWVDGMAEFASPQRVTALMEEAFTIEGNWKAPPEVTFSFTDCGTKSLSGASMHIDGAAYNGISVTAAAATLNASGDSYTFAS